VTRTALAAAVDVAMIVATTVALTAALGDRAHAQQPAEATRERQPTFEVSPRGYVQLDWRGYPDWTVVPGSGRLNRNTLEVRRARFGLDGRWRALSFELTVDPQDNDGTLVKDAYAQLRLPGSLRLRGGQFKLPGSREYLVSARSVDFLERSALADSAAAGRDLGAMLTGRVTRAVEYQVGLFAGDGNGRGSRTGLTAAGRVEWTMARDLVLSGSVTEGRTEAVDADPGNGIDGRSSSGYRFFEGLYVDGWRTRAEADLSWEPGPWRLVGEVLRVADGRQSQGLDLEDLPSVVGLGWSASVRREFGRRRGAARARLREWDLGLRIDALGFDDVGADTGRDSVRLRATDVRARGATTLTAGGSWSPSRWARVLADAALERYTEPRSAPEAGRRGNYWTFGTRLQIELP
jgi:hypothetical protein